jgi:hypothetical protein
MVDVCALSPHKKSLAGLPSEAVATNLHVVEKWI